MLKTPCIKFVAQATSYLIFLCLIVIHGQIEQSKLCPERLGDHESVGKLYRLVRHNLSEDIQNLDKLCIRNHKPAVTEICIVFWITGNQLLTSLRGSNDAAGEGIVYARDNAMLKDLCKALLDLYVINLQMIPISIYPLFHVQTHTHTHLFVH